MPLREALLLLLPFAVFAHIEDVNPEVKPSTTRPFVVPDLDVYDDDVPLVPEPAVIFTGRSKRAIHDPVADFLDEQAATAVFGDRKAGPSTLVDFNEVPEKHLNSGNAVFRGPPAPPPPPPPPSPFSSESKFTQGLGSVIPPSSTKLVPYDLHIDPDFPLEAPRARGLVNIPEGWNSNRQIDWEFKAGYRWNNIPAAAQSTRNFEIAPRARYLRRLRLY